MKTPLDRRSYLEQYAEKQCLPYEFERVKGSRDFRGEVISLSDASLVFRSENGRIISIQLRKPLEFPLPEDRRIEIRVTGKPGAYTLVPQRRRLTSVPPMATAIA